MDPYQLITRNLQEIIGDDKLRQIVATRPLKLYWGTSPTGKPHIGYLVPLIKLADFINAKAEVTILIADLHAYLDSMKLAPTWDLVNARSEYYIRVLTAVLKTLQVDLNKIKFVKGTDYQEERAYTRKMYELMAKLKVGDAIKAASEVVKQTVSEAKAKSKKKGKAEVDDESGINYTMSGLMYSGLQALDEEFLGVDAQFGGVDQRKIFALAHDYLPKIGYAPRIHLMNPLVPSFTASGKMSSSEENSKIDFLDMPNEVKAKIRKAFCIDGDIQNCPLLQLAKFVIFPICEIQSTKFIINRPEQYGGKLEYESFEELERAFGAKELFSVDLKLGVTDFLNEFLGRVRENLDDVAELIGRAYL